jgi:hypothetical protein
LARNDRPPADMYKSKLLMPTMTTELKPTAVTHELALTDIWVNQDGVIQSLSGG